MNFSDNLKTKMTRKSALNLLRTSYTASDNSDNSDYSVVIE
jgi:hypothetical protein